MRYIRRVITHNQLRINEQFSCAIFTLTGKRSPQREYSAEAKPKENYSKDEILEIYKNLCANSSITPLRPLSDYHMEILLKAEKKQAKIRLRFLLKGAVLQATEKWKKQLKVLENRKMYDVKHAAMEKNKHINYGIWKNSLFVKYKEHITSRYYEQKHAIRHFDSDPFVLDCGYQYDILKKSCSTICKQIHIFSTYNRTTDFPFTIYLCNLKKTSELYAHLNHHACGKILEQGIIITDKCYLDIFDRERIIYLSADSRKTLNETKEGRIFVTGAIADQGCSVPYSLTKCRQHNLESAKLPLDRFLNFKSGRELAVHVVGKIMINNRHGDDWRTALACVPQRLVYSKQPAYKDEYGYPNF